MITRKQANEKLLTDELMSDVKLRGVDGKTVLAIRSLLAARSTVFQSMLYGSFEEAKKDIVDIGNYNGNVLQYLVEFIVTEDSKLFKTNFTNMSNEECQLLRGKSFP